MRFATVCSMYLFRLKKRMFDKSYRGARDPPYKSKVHFIDRR